MKKIFLVILITMLIGCVSPDDPNRRMIDQCLRNQIFQQCLATIPQGPQFVEENGDWEGVVQKCENAAYYQSQRFGKHIKSECKSF